MTQNLHCEFEKRPSGRRFKALRSTCSKRTSRAHLLDLLAHCFHLWYVAELPHNIFQTGLVAPHPPVLHTELTRVHQLVPVTDHLGPHRNQHVDISWSTTTSLDLGLALTWQRLKEATCEFYLFHTFQIHGLKMVTVVDEVEQSRGITLICCLHVCLTSGHIGLQRRQRLSLN